MRRGVPPPGWWCSRTPGHEGPCAARPERLKSDWRVLNLPLPRVSVSALGWNLSFHVLTGGDVMYFCVMPDE